MATIAFCGLGQMGRPMAERLLDAGHDLTVWNRTSERARPLADRGARVASTPREAALGAEIVITMVTDEPALSDVVLGEAGVAAGARSGVLLVDMSTVGPGAVRGLRQRLPEEIELADSPVLGSVPAAEAGELKVLFGGSRDAFERARPILEVLGTPRHVGPLGSGAALKLVVNATLGGVLGALAEALLLGERLGLPPEAVREALEGAYVGVLMQQKLAGIVGGDWSPRFKLSLAAKDFGLALEAAERAGVRLPVTETARRLFDEAVEAGFGDLDYSALIKYLRERK